jgi:PAS domain S-box-containing protein
MNAADLTDAEILGVIEALRHVPAAVVVVDASGRVIHANARATELTDRHLGGSMPDHLDRGFDIFRLDGRRYEREDRPVVRSLTSGEQVLEEEYFQLGPDGGRVVIRCSSAPVYDAQERIVAGVMVMVDITADKQMQERLSYFDRLLENTDDAIVGTDADFRLTLWNAGAERLYGYTAEEILGRHAREVASYEGDQSRLRLEGSLLEGDRTRSELTPYRKDATRVEVEMVAVAVRDDRGQVVGYLGVHRDMTERKRAEEERQQSLRQIETILESITDSFYALDRDFRFSYLNQRAVDSLAELLGASLTREDFLGRSVWGMFPAVLGTDTERNFRRTAAEQTPLVYDYFYPPTRSWFEIHTYPYEEGIAVYFRAIEDRKKAEREFRTGARQQAVVATLGVLALGGADLQAVLDAAAAALARTLQVEITGVAEILADRDKLILRAGVGWNDGSIGGRTGPAGRGSLVGYTALTGQTVVSEDLAADTRFEISAFLADHAPVSAMAVVIPGQEEPFGVLGAFATQRRSFSAGDVNFMQAVANVISVAFEAVRTESRLEEVRDTERRRIARDLHDDALQDLTGAMAEASRRSPAVDSEARDELVAALQRVARRLRGTIYDLRLEETENRSLPERLEALVAVQAAIAAGPEVKLAVSDGTPAMPGHRGTEVVRIVAEAVTNARRHAQATEIQVRAGIGGDAVWVEVADNGTGFDPGQAASNPESSGLKGMRERADLLDAALKVRSQRGGGTVVRLELYPSEAER